VFGDLAGFVHARLAEQASATRNPLGICDAAMRHSLALLLDTWGASWELDRAGPVWRIQWGHEIGDPCSVSVESEFLYRTMALHQGSLLYPELGPLVPTRPADACDCPGCDGQGVSPEWVEYQRLTGREPPLCYCGGLGWLPRGTQIPGVKLA
jgi:hypothetical protein